jgi:hypothetical protein
LKSHADMSAMTATVALPTTREHRHCGKEHDTEWRCRTPVTPPAIPPLSAGLHPATCGRPVLCVKGPGCRLQSGHLLANSPSPRGLCSLICSSSQIQQYMDGVPCQYSVPWVTGAHIFYLGCRTTLSLTPHTPLPRPDLALSTVVTHCGAERNTKGTLHNSAPSTP